MTTSSEDDRQWLILPDVAPAFTRCFAPPDDIRPLLYSLHVNTEAGRIETTDGFKGAVYPLYPAPQPKKRETDPEPPLVTDTYGKLDGNLLIPADAVANAYKIRPIHPEGRLMVRQDLHGDWFIGWRQSTRWLTFLPWQPGVTGFPNVQALLDEWAASRGTRGQATNLDASLLHQITTYARATRCWRTEWEFSSATKAIRIVIHPDDPAERKTIAILMPLVHNTGDTE